MSQPSRPRSRGTVAASTSRYQVRSTGPVGTAQHDGAGRGGVSADGELHGKYSGDAGEHRPGDRHRLGEHRGDRLERMAPITSVSELTPLSSFGGDIVTIAAGPGGVFGKVFMRSHAEPVTTTDKADGRKASTAQA